MSEKYGKTVDPLDVDESWIGAEIKRISSDLNWWTEGNNYLVFKSHGGVIGVNDEDGDFHDLTLSNRGFCESFVLVSKHVAPDQPKTEDIQIKEGEVAVFATETLGVIHDTVKNQMLEMIDKGLLVTNPPIEDAVISMSWSDGPARTYLNGEFIGGTETTHSCTLQFPNGDIVDIPPPGEGWEEEVIFDEWLVRNPEYRDPRVLRCCSHTGEIVLECDVDCYGDRFDFTHLQAKILLKEYEGRIEDVEPEILSLSRWTREIKQLEPLMFKSDPIADLWQPCVTQTGNREATLAGWPQRHPGGAVRYD